MEMPIYLYNIDYKDLPLFLRQRLESCIPDETGYVAHTFVCPHCGSMNIFMTNDSNGKVYYNCSDCECSINEMDLELV